MANQPDPPDIELARRAAIRKLLCWYDAQRTDPETELLELESALRTLRTLPPLDGQLGVDITMLLTGGHPTSVDATIAAFERLRAELGQVA